MVSPLLASMSAPINTQEGVGRLFSPSIAGVVNVGVGKAMGSQDGMVKQFLVGAGSNALSRYGYETLTGVTVSTGQY
jgi:hypothetical protein